MYVYDNGDPVDRVAFIPKQPIPKITELKRLPQHNLGREKIERLNIEEVVKLAQRVKTWQYTKEGSRFRQLEEYCGEAGNVIVTVSCERIIFGATVTDVAAYTKDGSMISKRCEDQVGAETVAENMFYFLEGQRDGTGSSIRSIFLSQTSGAEADNLKIRNAVRGVRELLRRGNSGDELNP
jgi:hypothetical protein